jgi:hypothetical protein
MTFLSAKEILPDGLMLMLSSDDERFERQDNLTKQSRGKWYFRRDVTGEKRVFPLRTTFPRTTRTEEVIFLLDFWEYLS